MHAYMPGASRHRSNQEQLDGLLYRWIQAAPDEPIAFQARGLVLRALEEDRGHPSGYYGTTMEDIMGAEFDHCRQGG